MSGKRNLKFWCGGIVAILALGAVGWFIHSNDKQVNELKPQYAQNDVPTTRNINAAAAMATPSPESDHKVAETLNITFRAVGLKRVSPDADQELAFNVLNEFRSSPYFDSSKTVGVGEVSPEVPLSEPPVKSESGEAPGTFSFKIVAKLKRPLTL
jgi:hypothetical protein